MSARAKANADEIRFDRDIRPILSDKCFFCHGPDAENRQADLRLDLETEAKADAIVPGDPQASELILRILSDDEDALMPPPDSHKELTASEINLLTDWVKQGAAWTQHWSFVTPAMPSTPTVAGGDWASNPIDLFVLHKMYAANREPNDRGSREKLLRRVSYDLTGLPPTLKELDAYLADDSVNAYEKAVDRLLGSRHFGQRMAYMWMDAARYGDTSVYHADGPRDMWAWRDAVVDAYNSNMPFDEFSIMQLAGDLVPDAPLDRKILSGFNRNNGTTDEGGAIAEEYRVEYAVDRVKTTATVWMGLTMECAQCHDHKYDPISQEEYYKFFAFFNVSRDGGMQTRKGNAEPKIDILDPEKSARLPEIEKQLTAKKQRRVERGKQLEPQFLDWVTASEKDLDAPKAPTDMLANFRLDEGQKNRVTDSVNKKRKGTIKGKVEWTKSPSGKAIKFNGSNFVDLGDLANFERTDSFSYGGWIKPAKNGHGALLARMDVSDSYRGFDVLCGDNRIEVHIIHKWPDNAIKVRTKSALKAGEWQHLFVTYDGSSKAAGVKIYVDGEERPWNIEQDGLTETTKTKKTLLIGSRHSTARLKGEVGEVMIFQRELEPTEISALAGNSPINAILHVASDQRTKEQTQTLRDHFLQTEDEEYQQIEKEIDKLTKQQADLQKPLTTVMLMGDMQKPRETFILNRGAYDSPTDKKVQMGTMSALPPMRDDLPRNRLGLAKWLFQEDHPLTARVAVNRYWQMLFGTGLVPTPEDFGAQGEFPSHPELLDWLAVDFRESGWNIKRMIKQIVMSSTYRQSSAASGESYKSDPDNKHLARGPRFRLQGEMIRDSALFVSGLLVDKFGGPGVKPYQPPGLWAEVGLGGNPKFKQDTGEKLYRRSLYTYWKRSAPPPSMQIFDAPTREKCTVRRARTNTPLQALVTLNDVQFVESSRAFAQRMMQDGGDSTQEKIEFGFRSVTSRKPSPEETAVLSQILTASLTQYESNLDAAKRLLALGEFKRDESIDAAQHAAWTIVASALLNLDETLTRE